MLLKLGLGIVSGIATKVRDDKNRKRAIKDLDEKRKELDATHFKQMNNDFLDSEEGKASVKMLSDIKKDLDSGLANNVTRAGATPEAEVAKAAAVNKKYADAVAKLATIGIKNKETLRKEYNDKMESISDQKSSLNSQKKSVLSYII